MSINKNLLRELDKLVENNIITDEIANNIRNYYTSTQPATKSSWNVMIFSLGIIFLILGFTFLVAYNLELLGQFQKLSLAIFILVTIQILSYYTVYKNNSISTILKETLLLVYCLLLAGSFILVQQAFVLDGTIHDFLLICLISILPLAYLKPFNCPIIIYNFLAFFWLLTLNTTDNYWLILPVQLAVIPAMLIANRNNLRYAPLMTWQASINLFTACITIYTKFGYNLSLQFTILLAVLFTQLSFNFPKNIFQKPLKIIGYSLSHLFLLVSSFSHFDWILPHLNKILPATWIIFTATFLGNLLLAYLLWLKSSLTLPYKIFLASPLIIFSFSISSQFFPASYYISWIITLYLLILYLTYIYQGFRFLDKNSLNLGMLGGIFLVMCKVFDYELTFLSKGIIFIILGFFFILSHRILEKKQRGNSNE